MRVLAVLLLGCLFLSRVCLESTRIDVIRPVYPRYTNRYGTLYGGRLAWWVLESGAMAAMRVSRGYVVLGSIDYLFILSPVHVGEFLYIYSWVIGSTRHTLDVLSYAEARGLGGGVRPVSLSVQTYVSVDDRVRSREHGVEVDACSLEARPLLDIHEEWLGERQRLIESSRGLRGDVGRLEVPYRVETYTMVLPDSTFSLPRVLDATKFFYIIDEVGALTAMRATGSPVVTASFDAAVFVSPAFVGDLLRVEAGVTGVGRTSLEVLLKVVAENPLEGRVNTMAQLYMVLVSIGPDGRPAPPRRRPVVPDHLQREYEERRVIRQARRRRVEELLELARGLVPG